MSDPPGTGHVCIRHAVTSAAAAVAQLRSCGRTACCSCMSLLRPNCSGKQSLSLARHRGAQAHVYCKPARIRSGNHC